MWNYLYAGLTLTACLFAQSAISAAAGIEEVAPAMTREDCASVGGGEFAQCQRGARAQKEVHTDACLEARQLAQRRCMLDVLENLNRDAGVAPTRRWQDPATATTTPVR